MNTKTEIDEIVVYAEVTPSNRVEWFYKVVNNQKDIEKGKLDVTIQDAFCLTEQLCLVARKHFVYPQKDDIEISCDLRSARLVLYPQNNEFRIRKPR